MGSGLGRRCTLKESVSKAADAEGPFLLGVDELPLDETLAALRDCEAGRAHALHCVLRS